MREVKGDTLVITLSKGTVLMDVEDKHLLHGHGIKLKEGYVRLLNSKTRKYANLARLIMMPLEGFEVDHIDHNTLDNRKANLRVCTRSENARNNSGHSTRKAPYKGVYFEKLATGAKKWRAYTRMNGKRLWFGYFLTAEDAAESYNVNAKRLFGEFARLNVVNR